MSAVFYLRPVATLTAHLRETASKRVKRSERFQINEFSYISKCFCEDFKLNIFISNFFLSVISFVEVKFLTSFIPQ